MRSLLIGGCPRSGTTLLGSMLAMSPGCFVTPESQFKTALVEAFRSRPFDARKAWALTSRDQRFLIWGRTPDPQQLTLLLQTTTLADFIRGLVDLYSDDKSSARVWIDHTPDNLKQALANREIDPNCKFVHIVRDGRAVAASVIGLDWGPSSVQQAAHRWIEHLAYGMAAESRFEADSVLRVRYEDLVLSPDRVLREICEFAELTFIDAMLQPAANWLPLYTRNQHQLVGGGIDKSRVEKWKEQLLPREIELYEYVAGDLLNLMGYSQVTERPIRRPSLRERAIEHAAFLRALEKKVKFLLRSRAIKNEG